jgi:hypothetical protein
MKNQNDLIFSIVAVVVFLIVFCVCFFTKPQVGAPPAPEQVNLSDPALPSNVVPVMANALPGGSNSSGSGGGGGGGGAMGRPGSAPAAGSGPQMMAAQSTSVGGGAPANGRPADTQLGGGPSR